MTSPLVLTHTLQTRVLGAVEEKGQPVVLLRDRSASHLVIPSRKKAHK